MAALEHLATWALDDVPFGIALIETGELRIVYANRVYESWFAPDRRPILGKRLEDALSAAPEVLPIFRRVADEEEPTHFHGSEFRDLADRPVELPGRITLWDWSIWPLRLTGTGVTHLLVSGYDVTGPALDRLRLQEAQEEENAMLRNAAEELAALEHRKAEFLRFASHEMRGPLSVITAYASMLARGSLADAIKLQEAGAVLHEKAAALARMVDQVLEVSRVEDPQVTLEATDFDIRDVVSEATRQARKAPGFRHVITAGLSPTPYLVRADRDQVSMIVANLVDNAVKYSPPGTEITVQVAERAGMVEVQVADRGFGIAPEDQARLFSPFSRVGGATTAAIPGTGLGLYLCREAARRQGGDVVVQSVLGSGSVFTVRLPAAG